MSGLDNNLATEVEENDVIGHLGISPNHLATFMALPDCERLYIRVGNDKGFLAKRAESPNMITLNFTVLRESDGLPLRFLSFFYCEKPLMFSVLNGTVEDARDFLQKIDLSSFRV